MALYRRKDSPFWWYKFKPKAESKPIVGSTGETDEKVAQAIYEKTRTDYNMGTHFGKATKIKIADLRKRYLNLCQKQPSYDAKVVALHNFFSSPQLERLVYADDVKREHGAVYKVWRADRAKHSTVNRELAVVRHMFNSAVQDMGLRLVNPIAGIKFYSERKFRRDNHMVRDQKDRFFADPLTPQKLKNVVFFDIKTGLRQGEIRALLVTDLDFESQKIRVVAGEEDKTRFVPMFPEIVPLLRQLVVEAKAKGSKYVFSNEDGSQLSRHGWITTAFEWACKRLHIANLHFHDLRHTFASDFIMAGGDFKTLGEYMGHSTQTMTDRYAHLIPSYKAAQIMLLPAEKAFTMVESVEERVTAGLRLQFRSDAQKKKPAESD